MFSFQMIRSFSTLPYREEKQPYGVTRLSRALIEPRNNSCVFFFQGDSDGARRCATSKELISCINEEIRTPYENFLKTMKTSGERSFGHYKIPAYDINYYLIINFFL